MPGRHGQHRVEQEDAALRPRREVAGRGPRQPEVGLQLRVDVLQGRWRADAGGNGEAEPHRLSGAVIGILAEDHHADVVERRQRERVEDAVGRRVEAAPGRDLGDEELAQLRHVGLLELVAEHREPALVHPRLHPCEPTQ